MTLSFYHEIRTYYNNNVYITPTDRPVNLYKNYNSSVRVILLVVLVLKNQR